MRDLSEALSFTPTIERAGTVPARIVLGGMGGSASAAYAAAVLLPAGVATVHESYGLPEDAPDGALYLAVSYSGETMETLSFVRKAIERGSSFAAVASGGALLKLAEEHSAPSARVPEGMAPRDAFPYLVRAILSLAGSTEALSEIERVSVPSAQLDEIATELARFFEGKLPLMYTSSEHALMGRIFKMYLNESAKIPAFSGMLPERAHDELQGFDKRGPHAAQTQNIAPLFLRTANERPEVARHMDAYKGVLADQGIAVHQIELPGETRAAALFSGWYLARAAAHAFAEAHDTDPNETPLTRTLKERI